MHNRFPQIEDEDDLVAKLRVRPRFRWGEEESERPLARWLERSSARRMVADLGVSIQQRHAHFRASTSSSATVGSKGFWYDLTEPASLSRTSSIGLTGFSATSFATTFPRFVMITDSPPLWTWSIRLKHFALKSVTLMIMEWLVPLTGRKTRASVRQLSDRQPLGPARFATVISALVLVALASCYPPARRTMTVEPMVRLRQE
jgi:hypothetical protein